VNDWTPTSWRRLPAEQQPEWPDEHALEQSLKVLSTLPPLVFAGEARALRKSLAAVAEGKAFLLQAGDCAESFYDFTADSIRDKLKVILQMAVVLTYGTGTPVVKVGRIAGQFAKPRTAPFETVGGQEIPVFRGHMVNDDAPTLEARRPDPARLIAAYHQSASTLNLLRAFTKGGFADLSQVHMWNQQFVASSREGERYEAIAAEIDRALRFMVACGIDLGSEQSLHQVDFYTSHEALILGYEESMTRRDSLTGGWYDTSAHMVWCGERTRQLDGAHLHFLAGVNNPVAAKVGPGATPEGLVAICDILDPEREPGRLTLISRMGSRRAEELLPALQLAVRRSCAPSPRPGTRSCGRATRCTAIRSSPKVGARPVTSTTCWERSRASSPPAGRRGRGPAGCTSSSRATASPNVWAGPRRSSRTTWSCAIRPRATPGSTAGSRLTWPFG
jgi:3-deoxy-7-phosphoheptulonate synthase